MLDQRPPNKNDAVVRTLLEEVRYETFHAFVHTGYDVDRLKEAHRKLMQAIATCEGKMTLEPVSVEALHVGKEPGYWLEPKLQERVRLFEEAVREALTGSARIAGEDAMIAIPIEAYRKMGPLIGDKEPGWYRGEEKMCDCGEVAKGACPMDHNCPMLTGA